MAALLMAGCSKKKSNDVIITSKVEKPAVSKTPVRMSAWSNTWNVTWGGGNYRIDISRQPDDSLAMVKDETGQTFVDNRITLRISRDDGSVFLTKTFTKALFSQYLNNDYMATGILEGLVFDEVDDGLLEFAASVSHPQTDEYIPLELKISRMGDISIKRDSQMDTNSDTGDDDDD